MIRLTRRVNDVESTSYIQPSYIKAVFVSHATKMTAIFGPDKFFIDDIVETPDEVAKAISDWWWSNSERRPA